MRCSTATVPTAANAANGQQSSSVASVILEPPKPFTKVVWVGTVLKLKKDKLKLLAHQFGIDESQSVDNMLFDLSNWYGTATVEVDASNEITVSDVQRHDFPQPAANTSTVSA